MNRYQVLVMLGAFAVVLALVVFAVFITHWVKESRRRSNERARIRAIANARWETRTDHEDGFAVVKVVRVARWGPPEELGDQHVEVLDAIRIGKVSVKEEGWQAQVLQFQFDADQTTFQLNLEQSG